MLLALHKEIRYFFLVNRKRGEVHLSFSKWDNLSRNCKRNIIGFVDSKFVNSIFWQSSWLPGGWYTIFHQNELLVTNILIYVGVRSGETLPPGVNSHERKFSSGRKFMSPNFPYDLFMNWFNAASCYAVNDLVLLLYMTIGQTTVL